MAALILNAINLSQFEIVPGDALPVGPLIHVTGLKTDKSTDKIMLTDVYIKRLTALSWITAQFDSHAQIIPEEALTTPGVPVSQLDAQGFIDMAVAKDSARVSALSELGWKIPSAAAGATVYGVSSGTPAAAANLEVGDRIVQVAATPVHSECELIAAIRLHAPGTTVALDVRVAHISATGVVVLGAKKVFRVTLAAAPANLAPSGCPGVEGPARSYLGVVTQDAIDYTFPGTIAISTPNIGGPSAGLAMTLGLIDRLSGGSLTRHLAIAATGTIDPFGNVGDVGGVAQKTIAVEDAGARIFFVPTVEATVARKASDGSIRIVPVATLSAALAALERLGATAPTPLTKPYPLKAAT